MEEWKGPEFWPGGDPFCGRENLALDGKRGTLHIIKPDRARYIETGVAKVLDSSRSWAPLVLAHGRLLVRGQNKLKCLDLRKKK